MRFTNMRRLEILRRTLRSLENYPGPIYQMGEGKEGVDDDIYTALMRCKEMLESRIEQVDAMNWDEEAV